MTHTVQNQFNKYITDQDIIDEINDAMSRDLTYTYFNKKKITIEKTTVTDNERLTLVTVEVGTK